MVTEIELQGGIQSSRMSAFTDSTDAPAVAELMPTAYA